jgi:hypothetical protein
LAVLAIGVGSWACKGDPQGDLRGDAVEVIAAPSVLFINQGETELVLIEVNDAQGNQLGISDFAMVSNDPLVSVVEDSTFNLVFDAQGNAVRPVPWTRARFAVTGVGGVDATVTASGGGVSTDIPVRVVPLTVPAAFANGAGTINDPVVITAPNLVFDTSPVAVGDTRCQADNDAIAPGIQPAVGFFEECHVLSVAADGSSMTVAAGPDVAGGAVIALGNVMVSFLGTLSLNVTTETAPTVDPTIPTAPGTDGSAPPALPVPANVGEATAFYDTYVMIDNFYTFTPAVDGNYTIELAWPGTADVDLITDVGFGFTLDNPEVVTADLLAGVPIDVIADLYAGAQPGALVIVITWNN